jgi:hypothetical protein
MQRHSILAATLAIAAGWSGDAGAQSKQCLDSECFYARQVRDFEIIDEDTLVVYVGRERCAYRVKVDPLYCNLTFLPDVEFYDARQRVFTDRMQGVDSSRDLLARQHATGAGNQRVCVYDNTLALETFNFANTPTQAPMGRVACEVRDIAAISDDELLEVYVDEGLLPPPPPIGSGELSRVDADGLVLDADADADSASTADDDKDGER